MSLYVTVYVRDLHCIHSALAKPNRSELFLFLTDVFLWQDMSHYQNMYIYIVDIIYLIGLGDYEMSFLRVVICSSLFFNLNLYVLYFCQI